MEQGDEQEDDEQGNAKKENSQKEEDCHHHRCHQHNDLHKKKQKKQELTNEQDNASTFNTQLTYSSMLA